MWIAGQWFGPEIVQRIATTVEAEPSISRRKLSRQVCSWLGWQTAQGKGREVSCRKALAELERRGQVRLPSCRQVTEFGKRVLDEAPAVAEVEGSLGQLGEVTVIPVSSRYSQASKVWNGMMAAHHYLGAGPLCGAQIRYLIRSASKGWVGGLSFSAATRRLKDREAWIGWSERARKANLEKVVCNSRFLIVPSVKVPHLASHVLALSLRRVAEDWGHRYGYVPVLSETFVDEEQFAGTCYRAANWTKIGQTAGRTDGYANGKISTGKKAIYTYPLDEHWQEVLCREPDDPLVVRSSTPRDNWVEQEFCGARIEDRRLKNRLYVIAHEFFAQPGVQVPQAGNGSEAKSKAAYRFFGNAHVNMNALLKGHIEATAQRIREYPTILAVQDTTSLNYTAHGTTQGLGPINTKKDNGVGLLVHDTMSFTTDGTPLGLLDVQCWARDPEEAGKAEERKQRPIEDKESYKWLKSYQAVAEVQSLCPETMLVSVGDREADIHELFQEAQQTDAGPKLLVRAERSRNRRVHTDQDEQYEYLWTQLAHQPIAGHQEIHVPRQGSRPARKAVLAVRYVAVTLKPPERQTRQNKTLTPLSVWAVLAQEVDCAPEVKSPLEWMLLTTVEVSTYEQAIERLRWYALRWGIEVYHRVLKSGCRIEDRRLNTADRIENCLAIDLVIAWRIFWLVKQGRETPNVPCDGFFAEDQWKVLCAVTRNEPPPDTPPPLGEAVRMTAKLGGFRGRKSDGEPGPTTLWRGLERLDNMTIGYTSGYAAGLAATQPHARDGP